MLRSVVKNAGLEGSSQHILRVDEDGTGHAVH
jgi:hypothetical protein